MAKKKPVEIPADEFELPDSKFNPATDGEVEPPIQSAPTEPATVPETPEQPISHPNWLKRKALQNGFTEQELAEMSTDDLKDALLTFVQQAPQAIQQPIPQAPKVPEPIDDSLPFDTEGMDEKVVAYLKSQKRREIERDREFENYKSQIVNDKRQTVSEAVDEAISLLGPKYERIFGKGLITDHNPQSAEVQARFDLFNAAGVDLTKDSAVVAKRKITTTAQRLYGRIITDAPEEPYAQANGHTPNNRVAAWMNGGVARPTQRNNSPEPKGVERAVKSVAQKMREQGTGFDDLGGVEERTLPD